VIKEDREGSLWLATGKGIARFSDGRFERYDHTDGLSDNSVQDLMIDREGSIWVGTNGGGVDRFRDEKFVTYSSKVGLNYDMVNTVIEDHTGAIWIGASFGGINRLKDGVITVFDNKKGPPLIGSRALGEDSEGTIWIGSTRGLYTLKNETITMRSRIVNDEPDILPGAFLLTKEGRWLMGSRDTLLSYERGKFTVITAVGKPDVRGDFISLLFDDRQGTLWISTENQFYRFKGGAVEAIGSNQGFTGGSVNAMYEDRDGVIWIGLRIGGFWYKEGSSPPSRLTRGCSITLRSRCSKTTPDISGSHATGECTGSANRNLTTWLMGNRSRSPALRMARPTGWRAGNATEGTRRPDTSCAMGDSAL
jgi:ligand-binding sensor domain-containing protein